MTLNVEPAGQRPTPPSEAAVRRVIAIVAIPALHLLIFGLGLAAQASVANATGPTPVPREPLLLILVSFLQAWCSLAAIGWAISRWPSHIKTFLAVLGSAATWALLIGVLQSANFRSNQSAAWAISLAVQAALTAREVTIVDALFGRTRDARSRRFSIMFLLIWTTVVALFLGSGRMLAKALGWTQDIFAWQYFWQIQAAAVMNAWLAAALFASLTVSVGRHSKILNCTLVAVGTMIGASLAMQSLFQEVGADVVDIYWLYGGQALFLLATLAPLHVARQDKTESLENPIATHPLTPGPSPARGEGRDSAADVRGVTAAGQTPPPPDSGR